MILADIHTHTSFSGDSDEAMENMIKAAISKNFKALCFTEHMDFDFPENNTDPVDMFLLDTDAYRQRFNEMKDKYSDSIDLLFGVELGIQPHLTQKLNDYIHSYNFDFIIGSEHVVNKKDPYYPAYFNGRSEREAIDEYFEAMIDNLNKYSDFDTLGHMDYVVRYGPSHGQGYFYHDYKDYIDEVLKILITKNIGLEVNTGGYRAGLMQPNPCKDIILRYKDLGGKIITIGSDAHDISRIGADFDKAEELIKECGFNQYYIYKNRMPVPCSFS